MITLIIPIYNELNRIEILKDGLCKYSNPNQLIQEIILVNDGSTDGIESHLQSIQHILSPFNVKIINIAKNGGKGNAINQAVREASQPWILCNDADLSYPMNQIDDWYQMNLLDLSLLNTVYFGSRELGRDNGKMKLFLHRIFMGRIYAFFIRLITGIKIRDTQCGYKLYNAVIAKNIFSYVKEQRFAFDVEVHYLLKMENVQIRLLPVNCYDVKDSKVHLISDSWDMFIALFRIVYRHKKSK